MANEKAKIGDYVSIDYRGIIKDTGDEFDTTIGEEPLEFVLGDEEIIDGLSTGIVGMAIGEKKEIEIEPEHGYGPYENGLTYEVPKKRFPDDIEVGDELGVQLGEDDEVVPYWVTDISGDVVTVDGNHPLSGKTLIFEVILNDIDTEMGKS